MDVLITNCSIIDGSGAPAFLGSVGVENGKLSVFTHGALPQAKEIIDGAGLTVTPGFIDAHSHGDLTMTGRYATLSKISQGITTQVAGQCGVSMFPALPGDPACTRRFVSGIAPYPELPDDPAILTSAAGFFDWLNALDNPIRTYSFVGLGTLRLWAMGYENRKPDETELARMKNMLRRCMREGALGLSTGLVYAPCCYAGNDEIVSLLHVVHEEGGFYATHPRNEADTVIEARRESLAVAREADVPLCVSHLKAAGKQNHGKSKQLLADIDEAVENGLNALIDCYPYMAGNTSLNVSIPPRYFSKGLDGLVSALSSPVERERIREEMGRHSNYDNYILNSGGFSGTFVSSCPVDHSAEGMLISDYAEKIGMDPFDAYCDILIKNGGLGLGIYFHMCEEDVVGILSHPRCVVSTDGLVGLPTENPHPRSFGTMARAFHLLTSEKHILSPEAAIYKMTGQAATFLRLTGKGFVRDGCDADILLLDLPNFTDAATYRNGNGLCAGIERVYAGGRCVYQKGELL